MKLKWWSAMKHKQYGSCGWQNIIWFMDFRNKTRCNQGPMMNVVLSSDWNLE